VKVKYPDSLTTWSATARVVTAANQFGIGDTSTRTKQPLIVRLEAPRFFVVGDQVTVSGVINNNTDQPMRVASLLTAQGLTVTGFIVDGKRSKVNRDHSKSKRQRGPRRLAANVAQTGDAKLKVEARGENMPTMESPTQSTSMASRNLFPARARCAGRCPG
jgi:uncharacterized protein YfaS (alpha-2-macroglobulin family)